MGRKLPWTKDATSVNNQRPKNSSPPPKRIKTASLDSDATRGAPIVPEGYEDDSRPSTNSRPVRHTRQTSRIGRHSRSQSPAPIVSDVAYMHSGLDKDDAWRMVEDEFLETAQSFTGPLHHAEYKRVMREAQERKANVRSRSAKLDSVSTRIRAASSRDTVRRRRDQKTRDLLPSIGSDSDEQAALEEVRDEVPDQWSTTALGGLMSYDVRNKKTLKGLEKITSDSRASRGLGPNVVASSHLPPRDRSYDSAGDMHVTSPTSSKVLTKGQNSAHSSRRPEQPKDGPEVDRVAQLGRRTLQRFIDDLDDLDDKVPCNIPSTSLIAETTTKSGSPVRSSKKDQGKKQVSMDEMPMFLA